MSFNALKKIPFCITVIQQELRLYPAEHPQIRKQLERSVATLSTLLAEHDQLVLGLSDGTLLINNIPCLDQFPALHDLISQLDRQRLQSVKIRPGIDAGQLLTFAQELPQSLGGDLADRLEKNGVTTIQITTRDPEPEGANAVYSAATVAVENICNDVRLGRIPSSRPAIKTAKTMVKTILEEPFALLAMTMLKNYDNYTFQHSVNVAVIAMVVGKACARSATELYELALGGLLHDLGKMTIDHQILAKPGKLNPNEFVAMQRHPVNGARILADMEQIPLNVIDIVNHHHLGYDRSGYPADARGRLVSPLADMVCIADSYDAMTSIRCYQRPMSPRQAMEKLKKQRGKHLHPDYLDNFLAYLGPYPVGTLVRLKNGTIGLIFDQNQQQTGSLSVKIIFDAEDKRLTSPFILQLPDSKKIAAEVNPALKGVNLNDDLLAEKPNTDNLKH